MNSPHDCERYIKELYDLDFETINWSVERQRCENCSTCLSEVELLQSMRMASEKVNHRLRADQVDRLIRISHDHRRKTVYRQLILACLIIVCSIAGVFLYNYRLNSDIPDVSTNRAVSDSGESVDLGMDYRYFDFAMIDISEKRTRQRKSWSSFISNSSIINNNGNKRHYKRYRSLKQQLQQLKNSKSKAI